MVDKFPTIFIPEQNDFIYCLTVPGIEPDTVTDIEVFASLEPARTSKLGYIYSGNQIKIPFRNLKQGEYNLWVTFISAGQRVSYNYKSAFKIVAWNNRFVNWEEYKQGSELAVDAGVCLLITFEEGDWATMWNTIEQLESLKENCKAAAQEAHEAAEYAKQEGDAAKEIYEQVKGAYESGELKGDPGEPGAPGQPGKDGVDGTILYPSMRVDPSGYLVVEVPECAQDANLGIDDEGFLYFEMPTE